MLSAPWSSLPFPCAAVDCLFSLFSTLLQRSNSCWLCHRSCHSCCPWISPVLLMSCFEHVVECFKVGEVIFGTLVNEKPAAPAPGWHRKVPSGVLSGEGSVKARSWGLADSATLAVTPAKSESPNFHNFNPGSCHNIHTLNGHAFKLWKAVFYAALLHFQHLLSQGPSNVRHICSPHPEPL